MGREEILSAMVGIDEAAHLLGVSPFTVRRWISQKRVPYTRFGRCIRFDPRTLARYVAQNTYFPREETVR